MFRRAWRRLRAAFHEGLPSQDAPVADFALRLLCAWTGILLLPSLGLAGIGIWFLGSFFAGGGFQATAFLFGLLLLIALICLGLAVLAFVLWLGALRALATFRRGDSIPAFVLAGTWTILGGTGLRALILASQNPDGGFWGFAWASVTVPGGLLALVVIPTLLIARAKNLQLP